MHRLILAVVASILLTITAISQEDRQSAASRTGKPQAKTAVKGAIEKNNPSAKQPNKAGEVTLSPKAKKQQAMLLIEEVLAGAHKITPAEYGILAKVEAATLLWQYDQDRALSILKNSVEAMSALLEETKKSKTSVSHDEKQRRIRFLIFLKIARFKPGLIRELALKKSGENKSREAVSGEWSEESRALVLVAEGQINENPELAARLAEESLSLGMVGWGAFLRKLYMRDSDQAERLIVTMINRFRDSSISAAHLFNLSTIALGPDGSAQVKELYFSSLSAQLRQSLRPNAPIEEIKSNLQTARATQLLVSAFPRWQSEFADIVQALENMFISSSLPVPGPPRIIGISTSSMDASSEGNTQEISEKAERAAVIKDSRARDKQLQQLAFDAALNSDARLAEELLSKIDNEETRRAASLMVYGPLVRKELSESDWSQAQKYAFKIAHPLGRTIVLDTIAQAMSRSKVDNLLVRDVYFSAAAQLYRETPEEKVVKALLFLAKSLLRTDPENSLEAVNSAVYVLNKLKTNDELWGESEKRGAISTWLRLHSNISVDEAMDLTEMIPPLFRDLAKRDLNSALTSAYNISQPGLYSLARLGIARGLMDEIGTTKRLPPR